MRVLLWAGVVAPIIYFGSQIAAIALNPGFDIANQQPSELGMANAHAPMVANLGFIATGAGFVLGAIGLFGGLRTVGGNIVLAAIAALGLALLGVAEAMSGFFPLPNPLHYAFGFYFAGILPPLFGPLAFKGGGAARWIVLAGFVVTLATIAIAIFAGHLFAGAGVFTRVASVILFASIAYLCWALAQRVKTAG